MFPGKFQVRKFKQGRQQKIFSVVSTAVLPFPTSTSTSATASTSTTTIDPQLTSNTTLPSQRFH